MAKGGLASLLGIMRPLQLVPSSSSEAAFTQDRCGPDERGAGVTKYPTPIVSEIWSSETESKYPSRTSSQSVTVCRDSTKQASISESRDNTEDQGALLRAKLELTLAVTLSLL